MSATARFPLSRKGRRTLLVTHVAVSVGWLGLTLGLLALGLTGRFSGDPGAAMAAYRSMRVFGDYLIVPVSLLSLLSGLWLSLGTRWGLARHRWVLVKFVLTVAATAATAFALRPSIDAAAAAAASGAAPEASTANSLVTAPSVALGLYLFVTAISVLKPWGLTARGRRLATAGRRAPARPTRHGAHASADPVPPRTPPGDGVGDGYGQSRGAAAMTPK